MSESSNRSVSHGMLGTLRSDLDEAPDIHPAFVALSAAFQSVRLAYTEGRISGEYAATIMKDLRLDGSDGSTWTIGATSTRWYRRRPAAGWELCSDPEGVVPVVDDPQRVTDGIMDRIKAGTSVPKAKEIAESAVIAPSPVQAQVAVTPSVIAGGREDADWLFSEWEASPTPLASPGTPTAVGSLGLPENIPSSWTPENGLDDAIGTLTGAAVIPVERAASRALDALDEEDPAVDADAYGSGIDAVLPESYFLPSGDE